MRNLSRICAEDCAGALGESLSHQIGAGFGQGAAGSRLGDGTERADRKRYAEDPEVVVVDLIAQPVSPIWSSPLN